MKPIFEKIGLTMRFALLSFMVAIAFASCQKKENTGLYATVPADVAGVAVIDLDRVLKEAGCNVKDGKITLTADLNTILDRVAGDKEKSRQIADALQLIDRKEVVAFVFKGHNIVTFKLTDGASATASIAASLQAQDKKNDLAVYDLGDNMMLAVRESQGWLTDDISVLTEALQAAREKSISTNSAVMQFLGEDGIVKAAFDVPSELRLSKDHRVCLSVESRETVLRSVVTVINGAGELYPVGAGVDVVSTDFLRYLPDNTVLAVAVGNVSSQYIRDMIASLFRGHMRVDETLADIDGTVALGVSPAAGSQALSFYNSEAWDYFAMAHMRQDKVDSTVEQLASLARMMGSVTEDEGQYEARINSRMTLYFGNFDGYLTASTLPISPDRSNALTDRFEGKRMGFSLDIPYGSELMKATGLDYGINLWGNLQTDRFVVSLKFNGSRANAVTTAVEIIADNESLMPKL